MLALFTVAEASDVLKKKKKDTGIWFYVGRYSVVLNGLPIPIQDGG